MFSATRASSGSRQGSDTVAVASAASQAPRSVQPKTGTAKAARRSQGGLALRNAVTSNEAGASKLVSGGMGWMFIAVEAWMHERKPARINPYIMAALWLRPIRGHKPQKSLRRPPLPLADRKGVQGPRQGSRPLELEADLAGVSA